MTADTPLIYVDINETHGTDREHRGGPEIIQHLRDLIGRENVIEKPLIVDYMVRLPSSLGNLLPWQIKHMVWEYSDDVRVRDILDLSLGWNDIHVKDSLDNTERLRELFIDVGILSKDMYNTLYMERKRIDDFVTSMRDGRIDSQAELMRSHSLMPPVFIIEGSKYDYAPECARGMQIRGDRRNIDDIEEEVIRLINGMIFRIKTFWDGIVIEVPHDDNIPHPYTAREIVGIVKYLSKQRDIGRPRDYHHKVVTLLDVQRQMLQSIDGIGYKTSKSIVSYCSENSPSMSLIDIFNDPDTLRQVPRIGTKTIEKVRTAVNTPFKEAETLAVK